MAIQHSGAEATRPHAMRRTSSTENAMVQNGIETSSAEVEISAFRLLQYIFCLSFKFAVPYG